MNILQGLAALKAAAATVSGLEVFDLNQTVIPPAVVFGLPTLEAETFHSNVASSGITSATFDCYLICDLQNGFAVTDLLGFVNSLLIAIESTGATVSTIQPGAFTMDGAGQLPSYALSVTIPLDGT